MSNRFLLMIFLVVTVCGCSISDRPPISGTNEGKTETSTSYINTPTKYTITESTPSTVRPTGDTTPIMHEVIEYRFPFLLNDIQEATNLVGTLVVNNGSLTLINFDDPINYEKMEGQGCLSTSPNGIYFSYCLLSNESPTGEWLFIEKYNRLEIMRIPVSLRMKNYGPYLWLDNSTLSFPLFDPESSGVYSTIFIDAHSGDQHEIPSDYPGLQRSIWGPVGTQQFKYSDLVYDPTLDFVVYPKSYLGSDDHENYIILWNRKLNREVVKVVDKGEFGHFPLWSPQSDAFAVPLIPKAQDDNKHVEEWFFIKKSGEVERLSYFDDIYDHQRIGEAKWSPDGKQIGFWLESDEEASCRGTQLATILIETRKTLVYCLPGNASSVEYPPVWSLDGRFIAVERIVENESAVFLVDTNLSKAIEIYRAAYPIGWIR